MFSSKKVVNLFQLTISLVAILTYVMPINKVYYDSGKGAAIGTVFIVLNVLMLLCLLIVVVLAVCNLFFNSYNNAKIINSLCFMALLFASINMSIYSLNLFYALSAGYIVLFYQLVLLNAITQINGFIWSFKSIRKEVRKIKNKLKKSKEPKNQAQSVLKTKLLIKRKSENKPGFDNSKDLK